MKKRLYLVDGANYVFRAYYAIPHLSNSKGFPTGALYGFAQMLTKLVKDEKPDYLAVCFDRSEPTFRDEMYADYKANRKEPPDDLVQQFPFVKPIVEALGIHAIDLAGFEADDIIGTITTKFASSDLEVVIVSGDKDLMQLVSDNVCILDTMKEKRFGAKDVKEKFGVGPEGVTQVLGLAGDASDNVPGISGVGPKTAMKLIAEYGTIDNVIKNADRLKGTLGKKIREGEKDARLSLELVTIKKDVPIEVKLSELVPQGVNTEKLRPLFREFGFTKLLQEFDTAKGSQSISYEKYRLIDLEKDLEVYCNDIKNKGILSIDLETTSLDPISAKIVGFALCHSDGEAAYVPVGHSILGIQLGEKTVAKYLSPILKDASIKKVGQNLNYDLTILKRHGYEVEGVYFDTMLASYVLNPESGHGLDAMSETYLSHRTIKYEDVTGKGKSQVGFDEVPFEKARDYACEDADAALRLFEIFEPKVRENFKDLFFEMEMPLLHVLVDMQLAGMKVDARYLEEIGVEFESRLAVLTKKIYDLAGTEFNVNSPKQLGDILFDKLQLSGGKKTKTGFSTSVDVLEELAQEHDLPKLVLEYRSLAKLKSTYVDSLISLVNPETGRVHTSFNQARTATGRLSSSDPNLQNIPARTDEGMRIRKSFVADKDNVLVSCDYSQIELRVLAHLAGEDALIEAFAKDLDVHATTAAGIFGVKVKDVTDKQRAVGKTVNFATIYGQGAYGLSRQLGIEPKVAAEYIDEYFKKYPRVAKYRDHVLDNARSQGFVETMFGRRRPVPDIVSPNKQLVQIAERMAFNTVFQGTAADIIKLAMIEIHAKLSHVSKQARMLMQVHDELIFEVAESESKSVADFASEKMSGVVKLKVPLAVNVGIGKNWAEAG